MTFALASQGPSRSLLLDCKTDCCRWIACSTILHRITLIHDPYYWVATFPTFSPESKSTLWGSWFFITFILLILIIINFKTLTLFLPFSKEYGPMRRRNTIAVIASRDLLTKIKTLQFLSSLHNLNGKMYIRWRKWNFPKSMLLNWMEASIFFTKIYTW